MKINGFLIFATCCVLTVSTTSCQKIKGLFGKKKSATTGWAYNDSKNGGLEYNKVKNQKAGPGLIFIPGGTFVMGRTQEDVMGDWNNIPKRVSIASFYMDETEVRNVDWLEYLNWLNRVFVSYPEVYKKALPDTLVWRDQLGYNEPMVKNYLRFPAYAEYPVVALLRHFPRIRTLWICTILIEYSGYQKDMTYTHSIDTRQIMSMPTT